MRLRFKSTHEMSKLIFDLDGVIITYKKNFAETYSEEFGVGVEKIYQFFSREYYDCAIGRADLPRVIQEYIPIWNWKGDVQSLIGYWFNCQKDIDENLIGLIKEARRVGQQCYIASDQDAERSRFVKGLFDFDSVFEKCFFSCELGSTKADRRFFRRVLESLQCGPEDVYFWDDNPKNVAAAEKAGLTAEVYDGFDLFSARFSERFGLAAR